ncbi:hypothetical protein EW145_g2822 [Phellinidium pouzarii]|uniref:AB hydrolase-1 domain-containing protein n=1 Tax=Phellinidium pouzarii TaxID=167371 RepID=A0A4S4L9U1_9AGAM|nr:hypothetical protein EW145_g2822 [Phellinidium pouzarii]
MPLIPIDDSGNSLFYEDSGIPSGAETDYTTLIVVHGTAFHAAVFKRLIPIAPRYQIRLVLVNRRDYPNSSPYSDEDLELIKGSSEVTHTEFAKARGAEFATFIKHFAERERIPPTSLDRKSGGVVLMAWSSGNSYTIPLLAFADSISASIRESIQPFLRSLMIFDVPRWVLGPPPLDYGSGVLRDESLSLEERARRFNEWVSAYYTHTSVTSRDINDLQLYPVAGSRAGTTETMSADERRELTHYAAVPRSEIAARTAAPEIYAERVRRALFDDELAKYLPGCGVDVVWCERSTWASIDAAWGFEKLKEKADEQGIRGRPLRMFMMPGANHFPHWDEPEKAMAFFANVISTWRPFQ